MTSNPFSQRAIAHRGASGYAPENTMAAFAKAAQLGVEWVEFDVVLAGTGEVIVFHDEFLDRITNNKGPVIHHPYSFLRTLDVGSWFDPAFSSERIPTLIDVIDFLKSAKMNANIELKPQHGRDEQLVTRVLEEMSPYLMKKEPSILFSSFSIETLQLLRQNSPHCQIGLLMHEWLENWQALCESLQCVSVHVDNKMITKGSAQRIKATNKILLCYTVNDPVRAKELFSWGVDAVFSDVPDLILDAK